MQKKIMRILKKSLAIFLLLFLFGFVQGCWHAVFVEPDQLVLVKESAEIPGLPEAFDGWKIAILSDLHLSTNPDDLSLFRRAVALANEQKPDVIFLLGDFVDRKTKESAAVIRQAGDELAKLNAPGGRFAVMGNHERHLGARRVEKALRENGITVLRNEMETLRRGADALVIAGLDEEYPDYWLRMLRKAEPDAPVFLLAHVPDDAVESRNCFALAFSGHTHGGQIVLPLYGPVKIYSDYGIVRGFSKHNGRKVYTTSGIGTSLLRIRYGVPPEVVLMTIKRK